MKALTLTQPWATLVAIGAKRIETRSWSTSYRGPLVIHAAAGLGLVGGERGLQELCRSELFLKHLIAAGYPLLPRGAIVAVCELYTVVPTTKLDHQGFWTITPHTWDLTDQERTFGDYTSGRYAWLLADVRTLPDPIPAKGALGLWEWDGVVRLSSVS